MSEYIVYLCGHFPNLALAELKASLEAEEVRIENFKQNGQLVFFESEDDPTYAVARCSLSHMVLKKILTIMIDEKDQLMIVDKPNYPILPPNSSYCVRVSKIGSYEIGLTRIDLERMIGTIVDKHYSNYGHRVNLRNPDVLIRGILVGRKVYVGLSLWALKRKDYIARDPGNRPSFRPGAMKTDFARAMVNLSRIKRGEKFLDPFCGSGGFLIEAMIIGADVMGFDLDHRAIKASDINLKSIGGSYYSLVLTDARKLPLLQESVDGIVTDPPYAIQSSTYGDKITNLVRKFLLEARKILKKGKYLVFSLPVELQGEKIAKEVGFEVKEVIDEMIHRSLIRRVVVACNN